MNTSFFNPESSLFGKLDARFKIIISVLISLLTILLDSMTSLFIVSLVGASLFILSKPGRSQVKLALLTIIPLVWGVMVSQGFFYQGHPRLVILEILPPGYILEEGLRIYLQGIYYGLVQSLRMTTMIFTGYAICFSTSSEAFLKGLTALRVPFSFAFMASAAINFIPMVAGELRAVRQAMRLKGYQPFKSGLINTVKTELKVPRPALAAAIRRSEEIALSILTRGFSLENKRDSIYNDPFPRKQKLAAFLSAGVILTLAACKALFWLYQRQIFYRASLRPLYGFCRDWL